MFASSGLMDYRRGVMLPIARNSVEPLAAHMDPLPVWSKHQSLHHFAADAEWSDQAVLGRVRDWVAPALGNEGVVLADAAYGDETALRDSVTALGLPYVVGIRPATTVWAPGVEPLSPKFCSGRATTPKPPRREPGHKPIAGKALAMSLPADYVPRGRPAGAA